MPNITFQLGTAKGILWENPTQSMTNPQKYEGRFLSVTEDFSLGTILISENDATNKIITLTEMASPVLFFPDFINTSGPIRKKINPTEFDFTILPFEFNYNQSYASIQITNDIATSKSPVTQTDFDNVQVEITIPVEYFSVINSVNLASVIASCFDDTVHNQYPNISYSETETWKNWTVTNVVSNLYMKFNSPQTEIAYQIADIYRKTGSLWVVKASDIDDTSYPYQEIISTTGGISVTLPNVFPSNLNFYFSHGSAKGINWTGPFLSDNGVYMSSFNYLDENASGGTFLIYEGTKLLKTTSIPSITFQELTDNYSEPSFYNIFHSELSNEWEFTYEIIMNQWGENYLIMSFESNAYVIPPTNPMTIYMLNANVGGGYRDSTEVATIIAEAFNNTLSYPHSNVAVNDREPYIYWKARTDGSNFVTLYYDPFPALAENIVTSFEGDKNWQVTADGPINYFLISSGYTSSFSNNLRLMNRLDYSVPLSLPVIILSLRTAKNISWSITHTEGSSIYSVIFNDFGDPAPVAGTLNILADTYILSTILLRQTIFFDDLASVDDMVTRIVDSFSHPMWAAVADPAISGKIDFSCLSGYINSKPPYLTVIQKDSDYIV